MMMMLRCGRVQRSKGMVPVCLYMEVGDNGGVGVDSERVGTPVRGQSRLVVYAWSVVRDAGSVGKPTAGVDEPTASPTTWSCRLGRYVWDTNNREDSLLGCHRPVRDRKGTCTPPHKPKSSAGEVG